GGAGTRLYARCAAAVRRRPLASILEPVTQIPERIHPTSILTHEDLGCDAGAGGALAVGSFQDVGESSVHQRQVVVQGDCRAVEADVDESPSTCPAETRTLERRGPVFPDPRRADGQGCGNQFLQAGRIAGEPRAPDRRTG